MKENVLSACRPELVFRYFEDICAIPHPSGHEEALADYVEAFARRQGLACRRDEANNVFIRKPATTGHEAAGAVLLQGHMDMVGEKDAESEHDFLTDGLSLSVEDGWIRADHTTLGGDDGIAVAMMLALLDQTPEPHPALECLFTVSEETGLNGAWAFDPDGMGMTATRMINLDSEQEGVITAGCAGGVRTDITLPVGTVPARGTAVTVSVAGLAGGHSGAEIHKGHLNGIKLLGQLLLPLVDEYDFRLVSLSGGGKDNAIPRDGTATLCLPAEQVSGFCARVAAEAEAIRREPSTVAEDRDFVCTVTPAGEAAGLMMDSDGTRRVLTLLGLVRNGVLAMSAHVPGLVAFSRNLGIIRTDYAPGGAGAQVSLTFSTRSACEHQLDANQTELSCLAAALGATATHRARYPGWDYAPVSPVREVWIRESQRLLGVTPSVEVIHAGLECGILCGKRPGLDMISVGPDMRDIHTPREQLSVASTARTYALLEAVVTALS